MEHQRCFLIEWYRRELIEEPYEHAVTTQSACATSMSTRESRLNCYPCSPSSLTRCCSGIFTAEWASLVVQTCE
jgi:hypothetical protein